MATKPNIKDVYELEAVLNIKLEAISKDMVEEVLTGEIDSHTHDAIYLGITEQASDSAKLDNKQASDFAQLENGKIKATNLPDYLLGQVLYGGSINSSQVCTLSSLYKNKFNTTDTTRLLSNLTASSHVGVYFIASGSFMLNGTIDVNVGDWVISDGITWGKIDNTDAVASVNGQTGVINLGYENLGDMPVATDTEVGGIKIGFVSGLDADKLDGKDSTDFSLAGHTHDYSASNHNHDTKYLGLTATATDSDKLDGKHASDFALSNHDHDTTYLGKSAQALDSAKLGGQLPSYYEPAFNKNTAFNKDFGTGGSDVARGDHGHSELHSHSNKTTLDAFTTALKTSYDGAVTNSHTHSNKTVLDALTQAIIDNSHTHDNSTALGNVSGTNSGDETTQRIGNLINSAVAKTTPVDADMVGLMDSAASNILKKLSWARIKATLKTYFDTIYAKLSFATIKVGAVDVTASRESSVELIAGTNVTLTANNTAKTITIAATGGGSSSQVQVDFNITDNTDVRYILNKPAENRWVIGRISTLVDRKFQVNPGAASGSYNEGIRIANSSQGYSLIALGVDATLDTGVNADGNQWHLIKFPSGDIAICQGGNEGVDVSTGLFMEKGGDIYWRNTQLNGSGGSTSGFPIAQITLTNLERIIGKGLEVFLSSEIFEYDTPEFNDELLWDSLDGSFNLAAGKRYEVMINIGFLINNDSGLIRINLHNSNRLIKRTGQTFLDGYGCLSMTCLVDGGTSIFFEIEKANSNMDITLLTQECWFAIHEIE